MITDTEAILVEQREQSISPTLHGSGYGERHEVTLTLGEFAVGLTGLLKRLSRDPGRWILIAEDAQTPTRFTQFLLYEDGSVLGECASNRYLDGADRWTEKQEKLLTSLGWHEPKEGLSPNWSVICPTTSPDLQEVVTLVIRTLRDVFGMQECRDVLVKMFSSPKRGMTPAGESR